MSRQRPAFLSQDWLRLVLLRHRSPEHSDEQGMSAAPRRAGTTAQPAETTRLFRLVVLFPEGRALRRAADAAAHAAPKED